MSFQFFQTLDCDGRPLALDRARICRHRQRHAGFVLRRRPLRRSADARSSMALRLGRGGRRPARRRRRIDAARRRRRLSIDDEIARVVPVIEALAKQTSRADLDRHLQARGHARRGRRRCRPDQRRVRAAPRRRARRRRRTRRAGLRDAHAGRAAHDAGRIRTTTTSSPTCTASSPSACSPARWPASTRRRSSSIPGFGFGKTLEHNLALLRGLERFPELAPVMVGLSRKAMIGTLTGPRRRPIAPPVRPPPR